MYSEPLVSDLRRIVLRLVGCGDELPWLHRTRDGFIWTTGTSGVDICTKRSGAYAEWQGHCPSRPCTFHSRRRSQRNDAY